MTWVDIAVGSAVFSVMFVCFVSFSNKYLQLLDDKDEQSEMDRLRDAMIDNNSEMERR
jgi:hypothetical protein